jgi:site-specific DNA recombinase
MRAGLYARVSTKEQQKGWSIQQQLDACKTYATSQGWTVAGEYVDVHSAFREGDDDVSLKRPVASEDSFALVGEWGLERPNLYRLLADAEDGRLDVVLVWKGDRLARKSVAQDMLVIFLRKLDVRFVSITDGIDTVARPNRELERNVATQSESESRKISQRARTGKKARAEAGLSNASKMPFGYKRERVGRALLDPKPDPEMAPAVLEAYEAYATGQFTDQEIADLLSRKYPTYGRKRGVWYRGAARKMLQNPFYAGWVRHGDDLYPGQHEPIISQELFDQAQAVRAQRSSGMPGGRPTPRVYLLHRVVKCWHCGGYMHMVCVGKNRYYRDPAVINGYDCVVAGRALPMWEIDAQVAELVSRLRLPDDWRERLEELAEHREERENIEGKRQYLAGKLRRLRELYVDGDYSRPEYDQRKADLEARLVALQMPETPEVEQAGETLETLGQVWDGASKRIRRDMLRVIFEGVYVDAETRRVVCVKPWPPFTPLFRMDGLEERDDGCFYCEEQETGSEDRAAVEADPRGPAGESAVDNQTGSLT